MPITMLERAPEIGAGRKRRDDWVAGRFWTRWKKKVRIVSRALKEPQVRKTDMQIVVKARLRQREFYFDLC